jgi:hypothetical protein
MSFTVTVLGTADEIRKAFDEKRDYLKKAEGLSDVEAADIDTARDIAIAHAEKYGRLGISAGGSWVIEEETEDVIDPVTKVKAHERVVGRTATSFRHLHFTIDKPQDE